MRQTILKTVLTGMAAAALIGGVAACSSNQPSSGQTSSSAASSASAPAAASAAPESAAPDAYGQCMEDHGMPAPPGGFGQRPPGHPDGPPPEGATPPPPPGVDQDAWNNALQACASLAPTPPPR